MQTASSTSKFTIDHLTSFAASAMKTDQTFEIIRILVEKGSNVMVIILTIDSIMKTVGGSYICIINETIVKLFTIIYKGASCDIRNKMLSLKQTWNGLIPHYTLLELDTKLRTIDDRVDVHCLNDSFESVSSTPSKRNIQEQKVR